MVGAPRLLALVATLAWPYAGAAGALRVTATPASLRLAEGSRATVRLACAHERPVLAASIGRVEALEEVSSGIYEAEYVPPDSLDPQVAFVTAQCAEAFDWVPIVLAGIRNVTVSARPGALVTVVVDDARFGPVPADAIGRAVVRVVVPPGVRFATHGGQRIDLGVAPRPLVHVALDRATQDANEPAVVKVRAVAVDERGAPRLRAPIVLSASEGALSPALDAGAVVQATWKVPAGRVRAATVSARLTGASAPAATAVLELVAGAPRSLSLEVSPSALVAGQADEVSVTALVVDAGNHLTEADATLVATSPGTVIAWDRAGAGRWVGRVQVPSRRPGGQVLELEVAAGALKATRAVALLPGPAAQIRVEPSGEVVADGRARALRVTVLDASENRVDSTEPPRIRAERGTVGAPARHGPGSYRVDYRAPVAAEDFSDSVAVSVGPLSGTTRLRVRAIGGGITIAAKLGVTGGEGGLRSPAVGAELGVWAPSLGGLGLLAEARAFRLDRDDAVRGLQVKAEATFLALEGSLAWRRPLWGGLVSIAAGGGAVHAAAEVAAGDQPALVDESWAPVAHGSFGWGRRLGVGTPFGEVTLGWQGDAGGPVRGSLRTLTLSMGYRFDVL